MAHHTLNMPITPDQARALKIGDTVTLEKTLFGIRERDRTNALQFFTNSASESTPFLPVTPSSPASIPRYS